MNKKYKDIIGGLGLLALLGGFTIYQVKNRNINQKDLKENGCYTIGVTDGFRYIHKSGFGAYYIYTYNGVRYRTFGKVVEGTKYKGGRYLVKLSTKDPENVGLYSTIPIEGDSIPIEYRPLCSDIEKLE